MSQYNKAECIHTYIDAYRLEPKHIIFIDDFCQNVFNVAWYYGSDRAANNPEGVLPIKSLERVTSVWWDPTPEKKLQENLIMQWRAANKDKLQDAQTVTAAGAVNASINGGTVKETENPVASEDSNDPKYVKTIEQIKRGEFPANSFYPYTYG